MVRFDPCLGFAPSRRRHPVEHRQRAYDAIRVQLLERPHYPSLRTIGGSYTTTSAARASSPPRSLRPPPFYKPNRPFIGCGRRLR